MLIRRLFAAEIVWILLAIGLVCFAADFRSKFWVYSQGMPDKCDRCGMNHLGICPIK